MESLSHYHRAVISRSMSFVMKRKGFRTNRHIVVIESDDWGSIRMPSLEVLHELQEKNVKFFTEIGYDKCDSLASNEDLEILMDVLSSVKDKNRNPAKITLNSVVANPDFKKIKECDFTEYHYELFTDTLKRYPSHDKAFSLWEEGQSKNIFKPQFHGREHLNVQMWMNLLQNKSQSVLNAFDKEVFSMILDAKEDRRLHVLAAYNVINKSEYSFVKTSIEEGLSLFEQIFGFKSKSMIAPCYTWDNIVEDIASENGVQYIQGSFSQSHSQYEKNKGLSQSFHYLGEKNKNDQLYLARNCLFEPSQNKKFNSDFCLSQIYKAFSLNKPAIISAHRLNFIGELSPKNRDKNIKEFKNLLVTIVNKYPYVEFYSSDQLGDIISNIYY